MTTTRTDRARLTGQAPVAAPGANQAARLLRTVFTIAPIAFGLDKCAELLTDWEQYLAPWVDDLVASGADESGPSPRPA